MDSKGNFGKVYSRDMAYAASRYTEAKLEPICAELFRDIDSDTVDMVDNYDATTKEPTLLPTTFPNVLVSANQGIAVGMASNICSFNLKEVCDTTIALLQNPNHDILETLPGPDFSTGRTGPLRRGRYPGHLCHGAGAASNFGPSGSMSKKATASRFWKFPTPPPRRPSWTRWRNSSGREKFGKSPICGTRRTWAA